MKATWKGYLSLGNLKVPVQLYSAIKKSDSNFVTLHADDHSPVGRALRCLKEGKDIEYRDTVKAIKADDKYVVVDETDLEKTYEPEKLLSIRQFTDACDIEEKYYDKPYYIVPDEGGELAYTLLRQALAKAYKIAIARYLYYQKEHIGTIRVLDGLLILQQLRFRSEIVPRSDIKTPSLPQPLPQQVDLAVSLMQRFSAPFYIDDYRNEHEDRVHELVDRVRKGLQPKRRKAISPTATKEEAVVPMLEELLKSEAVRTLPS